MPLLLKASEFDPNAVDAGDPSLHGARGNAARTGLGGGPGYLASSPTGGSAITVGEANEFLSGQGGGIQTSGADQLRVQSQNQAAQNKAVAQGVWTVVLDTPFWKKHAPLYYAFLERKHLEAAKALAPTDLAIADLQKVRAKVADQSGTFGFFKAFVGNPLGMVTSALGAVATGGLSLGGDLAKRALTAAGSDQSKALSLIDQQIAQLQKQRARIANEWNFGERFETLAILPVGVRKVGSQAAKGEVIVGNGPWPQHFTNWYKRRVK